MDKLFCPYLIPLKFFGLISEYDQKHITGVVKMLLKQFVWIVEFIDCFFIVVGYTGIVTLSYVHIDQKRA